MLLRIILLSFFIILFMPEQFMAVTGGMTLAASDNAGDGQSPVEKEKTTFMTYTYPNGIQYVGEFRDGRTNGQGTLTWPNGDKYIGEFRDDKRHGQGTMTYPSGSNQTGKWQDDGFLGSY